MIARRAMRLLGLLTGTMLVVFGGPVLADAIDGDWCHVDGRRLSIAGPDIVTPGGMRTKGDYDRHHFNYGSSGNRVGKSNGECGLKADRD